EGDVAAADVIVLPQGHDPRARRGVVAPRVVVGEDARVVLPELVVGGGVVGGERPVDERAAVLDVVFVGVDEVRAGADDARATGDLEAERLRGVDGDERREAVGVEDPLVFVVALIDRVALVDERLLALVDHFERRDARDQRVAVGLIGRGARDVDLHRGKRALRGWGVLRCLLRSGIRHWPPGRRARARPPSGPGARRMPAGGDAWT